MADTGTSAVLGEVGALLAAFAALPPLTASALYFAGVHAPRHMVALVASPAPAPRVRCLGAAVRRSVPATLLTLVLGGLLWPICANAPPERRLTVTPAVSRH